MSEKSATRLTNENRVTLQFSQAIHVQRTIARMFQYGFRSVISRNRLNGESARRKFGVAFDRDRMQTCCNLNENVFAFRVNDRQRPP